MLQKIINYGFFAFLLFGVIMLCIKCGDNRTIDDLRKLKQDGEHRISALEKSIKKRNLVIEEREKELAKLKGVKQKLDDIQRELEKLYNQVGKTNKGFEDSIRERQERIDRLEGFQQKERRIIQEIKDKLGS